MVYKKTLSQPQTLDWWWKYFALERHPPPLLALPKQRLDENYDHSQCNTPPREPWSYPHSKHQHAILQQVTSKGKQTDSRDPP
jgi:hypothetical protein